MPSFFVLPAQSPEACDNSDGEECAEVVTGAHLGLFEDVQLLVAH